MTKALFLYAACSFFTLSSFSQSKSNYPWKIKISGGYTAAAMKGSAAKEKTVLVLSSAFAYVLSTYTQAGEKLHSGYYWSASVIRQINQTLDVGIGLGMIMQGGIAEIDTFSSFVQFRDPVYKRVGGRGSDIFKFRYLIFPTSLYIHPLREHNFYLLFQGWYANMKSGDESVSFYSSTKDPMDNVQYNQEIYKAYKDDNWGAAIGAGYDLSLIKHLDLSAEIKYEIGFENIIIGKNQNASASAFIQSLSVGIGLGFAF